MATKKGKNLEESKKESEEETKSQNASSTINPDDIKIPILSEWMVSEQLTPTDFLKRVEIKLHDYAGLAGDTGVNMGGTITTLKDTIASKDLGTADVVSKEILEKKMEPIVQQLESYKGAIDKISSFLLENNAFIIASIAAQGKIATIEKDIGSIFRRLEKVEEKKNINWNKTFTIISAVVAFLSLAAAVYFKLAS